MLRLLLIFAMAFTGFETILFIITSVDKETLGVGFDQSLFFDFYKDSALIGVIADVIYLLYKYIEAVSH